MNKISIEIVVDEGGRASAALKGLNRDVDNFTGNVGRAGSAGTGLRDVFTGNLLADFFQRGASAAVEFTAKAVQASAAAEDSNRVLTASATEAGLSYAEAGSRAEEFGKRAGLSTAEAQRSYASLIAFLQGAGKVDKIDEFTKGFLDLAAARGTGGAKLAETLRQFNTLSDEGVERILKVNPSAFYDQYAASINKAGGALTEADKRAAIFSATLSQSALFLGENEKRLQGTAGQLDTASAAYENLTTRIGDSITNSVEFKGALGLVSEALGGLTISHSQARLELAKGLKTPEQLAQEAREGTGRQILNAFKGGASTLFSIPFTLNDQFQLLSGGISRDDYKTRIEGTANAIFNPGQAQFEADKQRFAAIQREIPEQEQKAKEAGAKNAADRERQAGEASAKQAADAEKKAAREREQAFKSALGFIDEISARSTGNQNPFIKLFTEGETAAQRMQERFGALGAKVVGEFTAMERQAIAFETSTQRLRRNLRAVELEFSAEQVKKAYVGVTAEQERQLGILQRRLTAAANAPGLRRAAEAFERGFAPQNELQLGRDLLADFERVKALRPEGADEAARAGQQLVDDYVLERTRNLNLNARFSPDAATRQLAEDRARALRAQAERSEAELEDELKRAEAGRSQINLAGVKLQELARLAPGTDASAVRKEFLAITEKLDPKELSAALRDGLSAALREEAQHERQLEQEAKDFHQRLIGDGGILQQIKLAIESNDPAKARAQLPPPTPAETARGIAEFERRQFNPQQQAADDDEVVRINAKPAYDSKAAYEEARRRIEVNPFSQDFFRARPGFDPKNDPRTFNADDPYGREFLRAGYFNSYQSGRSEAEASRPEATKAADTMIGLLQQMLAALEKGAQINISVADGLQYDQTVLGAQPRPDGV